MRIFYFCASCIFFISSFSVVYASTVVDSDITTSTTWNKAGSPYIVSNTIFINPQATLTITPGSIIQFDGGEIVIEGNLISEGTTEEPIHFSSVYDEPSVYDYGGIVFLNSSASSSITHTTFSYVGNGIEIVSSPVSFKNVTITDGGEGINMSNSNIASENLIIKNVENTGIMGFNHSSLTLASTTLENIHENALSLFDSSTLSFTTGIIKNIEGNAFNLYDTSTMIISDVEIDNAHDQTGDTITLYNNAHLTFSDSTVKHSGDDAALLVFNNSHADIERVDFLEGSGNGIQAFSDAHVTINDSHLHDFISNGVLGFNGGEVTILHSSLKNNDIGLHVYSPITISMSHSSIVDNDTLGILNHSDESIDARNNWWGSSDGPRDTISGNVLYEPWLQEDPFEPEDTCCSNVLFIPGMESSRLYRQGLLFEDQLWEPNANSDVTQLYMTPQGKSVDPSIYTRDIIKRTNLPFFNKNIYQSFSDSLDALVSSGKIQEWQAYPYDWRLSIEDIITKGALQKDGTFKKIIDSLEQLASTSDTGKVTLITHSNGGLVAKGLITTLQSLGKENLVDNLIMVASPQLGTPQALSGFLHGHNQTLGRGLLLNAATARTFSLNAPVAYNLFPSKKYLEHLTTPLITFDSSINSLSNLYSTYGPTISDYSELQSFLTASGDHRAQPGSNTLTTPAVARQNLLTQAYSLHETQDVWEIPSGINVYQIVGTGLNTVAGISYTKKEGEVPELDYSPLFSNKGDGTVMGMSADALTVPTYYMNLPKYNNDTIHNFNHAIILETEPVQELIAAIIEDKESLENEYISTLTFNTLPQTKISIHSPVSIDLYDTSGRHTGLATTTQSEENKIVEEQIPNSYYMPFGEGVYTGVDASTNTTVVLEGTDVGTFTLTVGALSFVDIPVLPTTKVTLTTSQGSSTPLKIDFDGNGTVDSTITPSQDPNPLVYLQSLKVFVTSLTIPQGQKNNIINKIDKVITLIKNGKLKKAELTIKQYLKKYHHPKKFKKKLTPEEIQDIIQILTSLMDVLSK